MRTGQVSAPFERGLHHFVSSKTATPALAAVPKKRARGIFPDRRPRTGAGSAHYLGLAFGPATVD
jgi:hypothetical protein